jgi:glyoxylase-like metal-dependent hydrolase (beta-lactamase superfamily II)
VKSVGVDQANCYLIVDESTKTGLLVDPGAEGNALIEWIGDVVIDTILVTHAHPDHVGALDDLRRELGVDAGMHTADAQAFSRRPDNFLSDGQTIKLGESHLQVVHMPGHTPGSIGLHILDGSTPPRVLVGDAIFPGGPGHTTSPSDLEVSLEALARTVFTWSDETVLFPGHGEPTTVGTERDPFEAFYALPRSPDLFGDVTWR